MKQLEIDRALIDRHLACPASDARVERLLERARRWYATHGAPRETTVTLAIESIVGETIALARGTHLTSRVLARGLHDAGTRAVVACAVTAGGELDAETRRLWAADRPDEAFVLDAIGSAVAEQLRARVGARLAATFGAEWILPHWSPGYPGWPLSDQQELARAIGHSPVEVLASGGLRPTKSTLAVFGLAERALAEPREEFWPRRCRPVRKREAPTERVFDPTTDARQGRRKFRVARGVPRFAPRALEAWARDRLTIEFGHDRVHARFRFDGTTCANLGHELPCDYSIEVDTSGDRPRIARCALEPRGSGHRASCACLQNPEAFQDVILEPPPILDRFLDEALEWAPESASVGCLCTAAARNHKWRMALHTLHWALSSAPGPAIEKT